MGVLGGLTALAGIVALIKPSLLRLPNRWAALAVLVVGIVISAAGGGGSETPATQPATVQTDKSASTSQESQPQEGQKAQEPAPAHIGDPVQAGDMVLTVTEVERSKGDEFNRPQQGKVFLFVRIRLENKGDASVPYNMFDAKVRDKNGNIERVDFPASVALGNRPQIEGGELAPGGKVEGWLGFQIPADDKEPVFVLEHGFLGTREVEVILTEK